MFAGGVLSWLVLLPLLSILGASITAPFPPIHPNFANNPATGLPFLISEMTPGQIWSAYIRYIGAGAVLAAGLITLARTMPTIVVVGPRQPEGLRRRRGGGAQLRTERDMPDDGRARRLAAARHLPGASRRACRRRATSLVVGPDHHLRLLLRHRVVAHHRPDRLVVEPDLGHDDRDADPHVPDLRRARLDRRRLRARSRSASAPSSASPPPTPATPRRTSRPATSSARRRSTSRSAW